ncbi:MAG: GntR family transcriptional regulator [Breznakibacter sp.]|nr:GntR family transcriptional regulator [Breznakibacter sp.]
MLQIGKLNQLTVVKELDFGIYLDGLDKGEILMPRRYVPHEATIGETLECFIYLDSEDRLIATTDKPYLMVGEFALLKAKEINRIGAFMDWGLMKDLLVPFSEQTVTIEVDHDYFVYCYVDTESQRIVGSCKLDKFLDNVPPTYEVGDEVDIMVCNLTDIGYNVIINNLHWGMLYKNEVFRPLKRGERTKAYIKKIREDDKIDLSITKPGFQKIDDTAELILSKIEASNGFLPLTDKSDPDTIYKILGISKKSFKMTIGVLYKQRLITLEKDGIKLVKK